MRKSTIFVAVVALAAIGVGIVLLGRSGAPGPGREVARAKAPPGGAAVKTASVLPAGRMSLVARETAPPRDLTLREVQGRFEAEGLSLKDDGTATYRSGTDQHATQRLVTVEARRGDGKLHVYPRSSRPEVRVDNAPRRSRLTYREVTPGVDLEYAYRGISLKETLRVRPSLTKDLVARGADTLVLVHRLSDLNQEGQADLRLLDASLYQAGDGSHGIKELHLGAGGQSVFSLPRAFAIVGGGKRHLERRVRDAASSAPWLEVVVPVALLQEADGEVEIDPSMVSAGSADLRWWADGGRNIMVKDSQGRIHLAFRKQIYMEDVDELLWHVVVATGDGQTWEVGEPVYPLDEVNQDRGEGVYKPDAKSGDGRRYGNQADPVICLTSPEVSENNPHGETLHLFWKAQDCRYWCHYRDVFHAFGSVTPDTVCKGNTIRARRDITGRHRPRAQQEKD